MIIHAFAISLEHLDPSLSHNEQTTGNFTTPTKHRCDLNQ